MQKAFQMPTLVSALLSYASASLAFRCKCSFSNNRNKEITPANWLSTMCEFLFTSYRQQQFYPRPSCSCSTQVWQQPRSTRPTASRAQPVLELCSPLLSLPKSHATGATGHCHQCVTVPGGDPALAMHQCDLPLPVGLPRPLLFWFSPPPTRAIFIAVPFIFSAPQGRKSFSGAWKGSRH